MRHTEEKKMFFKLYTFFHFQDKTLSLIEIYQIFLHLYNWGYTVCFDYKVTRNRAAKGISVFNIKTGSSYFIKL